MSLSIEIFSHSELNQSKYDRGDVKNRGRALDAGGLPPVFQKICLPVH